MIFLRTRAPLALILVALLFTSGCESSKERAQKHYESAVAFIQAGDTDRALVELRNVFKLDGSHREARRAYAKIMLDRGRIQDAYAQYLRLVEQYPDDVDGLRSLASLSFTRNDWDSVERYDRAALALAPDDPVVKALSIAVDYHKAALAKDPAAEADAAKRIAPFIDNSDTKLIAYLVMINQKLGTGDAGAALTVIDAALVDFPDNYNLNVVKLQVLNSSGDSASLGAHLKEMYARFPQDERTRNTLIAWYMQQKDYDGAEAFLRGLAAKAGDDPGPNVTVVMFLRQARGADAAQEELKRLIATGKSQLLYRGLLAGMDFDAGQHDAAIAELQAALKDAEPGDQVYRSRVALAKMLAETGDAVGARAQVEQVLDRDPGNVEALKMHAAWLIDEDKTGDAIISLRKALDQAPRDPEILTLMAAAHARDGAHDLAGDRLSMAVEVSNKGAAESIRYAQFLVRDKRYDTARSVIEDALHVTPDNLDLLDLLGRILLLSDKWDDVNDVVARLRRLGTPEADNRANGMQAALLLRQNKTAESIAFLQNLIDKGAGDVSAMALIVQANLRQGHPEAAKKYLDEQLVKSPDNPDLLYLSAGLHVLMGETDQAEAIYRDLVAKNPAAEGPQISLYRALESDGKDAEAQKVLDAALAANPKSGTLRWIRAGHLERAGDIEGAIAIYDELYAENSNNTVVANNLASLLATYREDASDLDRALTVARRLRDAKVPAFQDTYGWIQYRRGKYEDALTYLEPAAAGLPADPTVQVHLGLTYAALERPDDARRVLEAALAIAGNSLLPQFKAARDTLAKLPEKAEN